MCSVEYVSEAFSCFQITNALVSMKRSLILCLFCLCGFFLNITKSQYASIFGQDSINWTMTFCQLDQSGWQYYTAYGDTVINGKTYTRAGYITDLQAGMVMFDCQNSMISTDCGWIREDTSTGQVWFRSADPHTNNTYVENLVMDLSLGLGDSILVDTFAGPKEYAVVDSIYFAFGRKHVKTNKLIRSSFIHPFGAPRKHCGYLTFIEGIGPNVGFGYVNSFFNLCPCMVSMRKDRIEQDWDVVANVDASVSDHVQVKLAPHPIREGSKLEFENSGHILTQLDLYSPEGRLINSVQSRQNSFELSNHKLAPGIYLLRLTQNGKAVYRQKVLVLE